MLKLLSSKTIEKILKDHGFIFTRRKGSHAWYVHPDGRKVTLTINRKEIPIGTLKSIIRQSNLPFNLFLKAS